MLLLLPLLVLLLLFLLLPFASVEAIWEITIHTEAEGRLPGGLGGGAPQKMCLWALFTCCMFINMFCLRGSALNEYLAFVNGNHITSI